MSGRVRIITDSVSDLLPEVSQRLGIGVVPIYFSLNGRSYCDDGTLDRRWFFNTLTQSRFLPQTAAPSIEDFLRAYRTLYEQGAEQIVALFVQAQLSSLIDHAKRAAKVLGKDSIHFIETGQVTMGQGWLAVEAAEAAAKGASVSDIRHLVERRRRRTFVVGALASLEYLQRGGRVGWVKAQIGEVLNLKPLIGYHQGEASLLGRARTYRRAIQWLIRWVERAAPLKRLSLLHTGLAAEILTEIRHKLTAVTDFQDIQVVEAGPVFTTHVGPNAVGVALIQSEAAAPVDW